jgi:DNA-binding response OmpR family regulator
MITACDGPSSFLDVLLYSCGWSFLFSSDVAAGGDGDIGDIGDNNIPPWIIDYNDDDGSNGSSNRMLWRLPNCIISDIRMPGGVDGVQLLQLLRQQRQQQTIQSQTMGRQSSKKKKKGRERKMQKKKKDDDENEYDGKDDFELLDAIVGNGGGKSGGDVKKDIDRRRIVTAIDQANQKLDVISDTLSYHQEAHNNNSEQQQQQYPNSLHQIPVILLTAKAMVSDRIVGYRAGANNYLPKPFRPEELLGMVDSLMRKQERERREWMIGRSMIDLDGGNVDGGLVDTGKRSNNANILQSYTASAQQLNDLKTELMEIKNLLKEEAMQQNKAKVELEEVEGLTRLLPEAIWMFMNGERRKRLFTSDHIRSILKFCFDDDDSSSSLPRRASSTKRDDLLEELERMNEEYPDRVQDYISIS